MKTNIIRGIRAAFFVAALCLGLTAQAEEKHPANNASNGDLHGQEGFGDTTLFESTVRRSAKTASVVQTPAARVETYIAVLPNTSHSSYQAAAGQLTSWLASGAPSASKPSTITDKLAINGILAAGNSDFGFRTHFPLSITSSNKFNLSGIAWRITSSDNANSLGYLSGLDTLNYDPVTRVGTDFGADNREGGVGNNADTARGSGPGSEAVNRLAYVGAGNAYRANSPGDIDGATTYFNGQRPFTLTCAYRVQFLNGGVMDIVQTASSFGAATLTSVQEGDSVRLQLGVTGDATGVNFAIQSSTDLTNWANIGTTLTPGGTTTIPVNGAKFFRAYRP